MFGVRKDGGGEVDGGEGGANKIQSTFRGNPHDRNLLHYQYIPKHERHVLHIYVCTCIVGVQILPVA